MYYAKCIFENTVNPLVGNGFVDVNYSDGHDLKI